MKAVIQTDKLTKDYGAGRGVFALDLEVMQGEIFGFLGPNGSGKTTTMRVLLGLIKATSGTASVLSVSLEQSLSVRGRIGYLAGDFGLYPKLTGHHLLKYFAQISGGNMTRVEELKEVFAADLDTPVRELSSGNRQKIGLIQAMMGSPELLILDEPITGLDPLVQSRFHQLLLQEKKDGHTVFLSSHTLSEVERVADKVGILRQGRLVVVDSLENLRSVALQSLEIDFITLPSLAVFKALPEIKDISLDGSLMRLTFSGSPDSIIKALSHYQIRTLHSKETDLENVFLRYYAGDEK